VKIAASPAFGAREYLTNDRPTYFSHASRSKPESTLTSLLLELLDA